MLVFHAHWSPVNPIFNSSSLLFWAETSEALAPVEARRGRLAEKPRPRLHPYCAPLNDIRQVISIYRSEGRATLRLPTTRSGPLPSPELAHDWNLDRQTAPSLAPWIINGVCLPPEEGLPVLLDLAAMQEKMAGQGVQLALGADANFWRLAAGLALETLAGQKILPVLEEVLQGEKRKPAFHARWLPVLDGPQDAVRLAQLEAAMPPVCRAEVMKDGDELSPRRLLGSFLKGACDALARSWAKSSAPRFGFYQDQPAHYWIKALFTPDPQITGSQQQLKDLLSSQHAWLRNLYVAGNEAFRITFMLEAPASQTIASQPAEAASWQLHYMLQASDDPSQPAEAASWQLHYMLQASDDPSLLVPAEDVWHARGSLLNQLGRRFEQPQERLLAGLGYAARLFPPVGQSLKGKRPTGLEMDTQGAYTFLRQIAPVLEGAGFGLLVPPWWNKPGARLGLKLRLKPARGMGDVISKGRLKMENLVEYRWDVSVGETALTEAEFMALAQLKSPLVQIRGQWVLLDPQQVEAAIKFWEKRQIEGQMGLLEAAQIALVGQAQQGGLPVDQVAADGWVADWLERFNHPAEISELPQPAGLDGALRPYQRFGFSWLHFHRRFGLGACLADDMGLGKTIQTLALILQEKEEQGRLTGPVLLVCPTSVVTNWEREIRRFAPSLTSLVHQGAGRLRGDELLAAARSVDMLLTSYALARLDADTLKQVEWLGVVLDEAQNIKNPSAKQTQAVRSLPANFRLALTGTPVENRLSELWSIMHFLNPGYLGSREAFRREFALPIERYNDEEAVGRLKQAVGPLILRRVKTDPTVIQDLPEKLETRVYCFLTEEQATLYQAVVADTLKQVEEKSGIERRGLVLSMLMQLKQICNHPVQYLHQGARADPASASQPGELDGRSGKLERLSEMLEEILAEGDRALIFTQFAEMGELLAGYLPKALGMGVQFLHGATPPKQRDQMVKRFQEDEHAPPVFILSLKAGGTGLNLTRANHVFHFDRWWNPAVEDQATDRAFRIGQKRNVQVHKFVTTGTLEEMIDDLIESKKGLAQAVVGSGEGWLTELSTADLRELVRLRVQA